MNSNVAIAIVLFCAFVSVNSQEGTPYTCSSFANYPYPSNEDIIGADSLGFKYYLNPCGTVNAAACAPVQPTMLCQVSAAGAASLGAYTNEWNQDDTDGDYIILTSPKPTPDGQNITSFVKFLRNQLSPYNVTATVVNQYTRYTMTINSLFTWTDYNPPSPNCTTAPNYNCLAFGCPSGYKCDGDGPLCCPIAPNQCFPAPNGNCEYNNCPLAAPYCSQDYTQCCVNKPDAFLEMALN